MAMITKTKVQAFLGSVIALVVLVLFAAIASALMGYRVPGLSIISDFLGIQPSA